MFLSNISNQEKLYFLELAHKLIRIDGEVSIYEEEYMKAYIKEMELISKYEITNLDTEIILGKISSSKTRKIFFVELLALSQADKTYHQKEKDFMMDIKKSFEISDEFYELSLDWISRFNVIYKEGYGLFD